MHPLTYVLKAILILVLMWVYQWIREINGSLDKKLSLCLESFVAKLE